MHLPGLVADGSGIDMAALGIGVLNQNDPGDYASTSLMFDSGSMAIEAVFAVNEGKAQPPTQSIPSWQQSDYDGSPMRNGFILSTTPMAQQAGTFGIR